MTISVSLYEVDMAKVVARAFAAAKRTGKAVQIRTNDYRRNRCERGAHYHGTVRPDGRCDVLECLGQPGMVYAKSKDGVGVAITPYRHAEIVEKNRYWRTIFGTDMPGYGDYVAAKSAGLSAQ